MKITYNKNPLLTTIELEEHEKKELWYKIKIEIMQNKLFGAHFHLKDGKYFDLERVRKDLDPSYYFKDEEKNEDTSKIDLRTDELTNYYIEALMETHVGDCTCVACSCDKCHAEDFFGINTIEGLKKHCATKINGAFGQDNERTMEEALDYLKNYDPTPKDSTTWEKFGGYEQYMDRWKEEGKQAYDWLLTYKEKHFKNIS